LSLAAIYVAIQVLVPLRNFIHHGGIEWLYMEHRFSWQMMLHRHAIVTNVYVTDPNTGSDIQVQPAEFLSLKQVSRMGWRPDMVRQFAHFLADRYPRFGPKPVQVEVRMFVSVNGRKPKLFIDPLVNLAGEPRRLGRPRWLLEIHDPLPPPGKDFSGEPYPLSSEAE
jgi:vitamin K-dependent gamma-carboxylase